MAIQSNLYKNNYIIILMRKILHPIQVQILKLLYKRALTMYHVSKILSKPTPQIQFHIKHLYKNGFLLRKPKEDGKGFLYYTNKKRIKLLEEKNREILSR